jgi:hypothetical protein
MAAVESSAETVDDPFEIGDEGVVPETVGDRDECASEIPELFVLGGVEPIPNRPSIGGVGKVDLQRQQIVQCVGRFDEHRVDGHGRHGVELFSFADPPGLSTPELRSLVLGDRQNQIEDLLVGLLDDPIPTVGIRNVFEVVVQRCRGEDLVPRTETGEDDDGAHQVRDIRDVVVGQRVVRALIYLTAVVAFSKLMVVAPGGESDGRLDDR